MIAKDYWKDFYKTHDFAEPSSFAQYVLPHISGPLVDLGCGDGRDTYFFHNNGVQVHGVDASNEDILIIKQDVGAYIKQNQAPRNVYSRFFWHAIDTPTREAILDWTTGMFFMEARTTKDKPKNLYGKHERKLVNVDQLVRQLEKRHFTIHKLHEGYGMSPYLGEDPHLVRVIAERVV